MFIHDYYQKMAIEAIKKDVYEFDENCLREIAYNEKILMIVFLFLNIIAMLNACM